MPCHCSSSGALFRPCRQPAQVNHPLANQLSHTFKILPIPTNVALPSPLLGIVVDCES
ncbi:hypothetical protein FA13DRAFT_777340 [Coprinellus micaceus]|uniref:Uncharacterized protein n=1 Tax=Coprinellus micaceus TaxID=71717 RepID=A0A4Y7T3D1_COPMI|nr:hypothetical protein FA13DRAFT_777340 [Coprinellus micaceus]